MEKNCSEGCGTASDNEVKSVGTVDLSPRIITDYNKIAERWELLLAHSTGSSVHGMTVPSFGLGDSFPDPEIMELPGSEEYQKALYALADPNVSKFIKVDVIEYPALAMFSKIEQGTRWYDEKFYKANENPGLVPLGRVREGFDDPWNDGKFPKGNISKGVELPQSCIWVDCPHCHGKGYTTHEEYRKSSKHVKCPDCLGSGWAHGGRVCDRCDGSGWVNQITTHYDDSKTIKDGSCIKCEGKGRLKSVLVARETPAKEAGKTFAFYLPNQKDNIPATLIKARRDSRNCSKALEYKVVSTISSKGKFYDLKEEDIPKCGLSEKGQQTVIRQYEELRDSRAQVIQQTIKFAFNIRFVRFHFKYYACHEEFEGKNYLKDPKGHYYEQVIWFDTATKQAYSYFPETKSGFVGSYDAFCAVFTKVIKIRGGKAPTANTSKEEKNGSKLLSSAKEKKRKEATRPLVSTKESKKRRWIFILLGIMFGGVGLHFLYAGRKWWFLFHWICIGTWVLVRKYPDLAEIGGVANNPAYPMIMVIVIWIGSLLFMKNDGTGKRM